MRDQRSRVCHFWPQLWRSPAKHTCAITAFHRSTFGDPSARSLPLSSLHGSPGDDLRSCRLEISADDLGALADRSSLVPRMVAAASPTSGLNPGPTAQLAPPLPVCLHADSRFVRLRPQKAALQARLISTLSFRADPLFRDSLRTVPAAIYSNKPPTVLRG